MTSPFSSQRGSAFLYILMAIALLAALSFALSKGSRVSGSMLNDEQARIAAQEIIDYGDQIAAAVQKLKLRGCADTQISFESAETGTTYQNNTAPNDKSCHVFDMAGGQVQWKQPAIPSLDSSATGNEEFAKYYYTGTTQVDKIGTDGNLTDYTQNELLLIALYLKKEVCLKANAILNVENKNDEAPTDHTAGIATRVSDSYKFKGIYTLANTLDSGESDANTIKGKTSACIKGYLNSTGGTQYYLYYRVLIAR